MEGSARVEPRTTSAVGRERLRDVAAALVSGQIGGVLMLVAMMLISLAHGWNVWTPLRAIGSLAVGVPYMREGTGPVVLGLVVHMLGFCVFWSLVYAVLAWRRSREGDLDVTAIALGDRYGAVLLGPLVGVISQTIDVVAVMPAFAQGAEWTHVFLGVDSWLYHLIFGVGLSSFPWVRRGLFGRS